MTEGRDDERDVIEARKNVMLDKTLRRWNVNAQGAAVTNIEGNNSTTAQPKLPEKPYRPHLKCS